MYELEEVGVARPSDSFSSWETGPTMGKQANQNQTDVLPRLSRLEERLEWHQRVGWGIVTIFGVVLVWLLTIYLPGQFQDKLPDNFRERFGRMEENVQNLSDAMNRLTPSALQRLLVPPPSGKLSADALQRADKIVDTAFEIQLPGNPRMIAPLRASIREAIQQERIPPAARSVATGTLVRLGAYEDFSRTYVHGLPVASTPAEVNETPRSMIASLTLHCVHPAATAIGGNPGALGNLVVYDLSITGCVQSLERVHWINTAFVNATIKYHGGRLALAGVRFKNCRLDFGTDKDSERLKTEIEKSGGRPMNALIPAE